MLKSTRTILTAAIFAATPAFAADLPVHEAMPPAFVPPPPVTSWTGCHIGVEGGGSFGRSQQYYNDVAANAALVGLPQTGGISTSGGLAGGTVGCDAQFQSIVAGLEGDFSWSGQSGMAPLIAPFNTNATDQTKQHWLGTFRGRIGFAADRLLIYATGGGAVAGEAFEVCTLACAGGSKTVLGYSAGAGVEYAVLPHVSVKLEYLHAGFRDDFGRTYVRNVFFGERRISLDDDIVRAGLNYRFDLLPAPQVPVVARY